ncbi:MAG: uracil-DNA glycosylase [Flavobacteriaceae bacterium]
MNVKLESSWKAALSEEFLKPYFKELTNFVRHAYQSSTVYPPAGLIFNALDSCPLPQTRVVILGQDPYHGAGQAHGLSFSVPKGIAHPPSLVNIFKELESDTAKKYPKHGSLTSWASQGVLLLNATLTVEASKAGSHQNKGWELFTEAVIDVISEQCDHVVFMLWGNYAKQKGKRIDRERHLVLTSGHPSPLSANRGLWFGNRHFSQANAFLTSKGKPTIDW